MPFVENLANTMERVKYILKRGWKSINAGCYVRRGPNNYVLVAAGVQKSLVGEGGRRHLLFIHELLIRAEIVRVRCTLRLAP